METKQETNPGLSFNKIPRLHKLFSVSGGRFFERTAACSALSLPRGTLALGGPRREFFFSPLEAPNPLTNYSDLKKRQDLDQLVLQRVRVVRQSRFDLKNKGPK